MNKEYNEIKNQISKAANNSELYKEQGIQIERQRREELRNLICQKYNQNLSTLKSTGIIEIFQQFIDNDVVALRPKRMKLIYGPFGIEIKQPIPEDPAYISVGNIEKIIGNIVLQKSYVDRPYFYSAEVDLCFDEHESGTGDDYGHFPTTLRVSYDGEKFLINSKEAALQISRPELIQKITQEIITLKGFDQPQARN